MRPFGTTIFAEMSALAVRTGAVNLGQGFPDTDGPAEMLDAAADGPARRAQPVPARPGHPRAAGRRRRAPAAVLGPRRTTRTARCWSPPAPPRRSRPPSSRCASRATRWSASSRTTTRTPPASRWPARSAGRSRCARPDGRYGFDPDELRAAFAPRTRLVLLNSPHNPTGKVFTARRAGADRRALPGARRVAVTDEVYEHLVFTDAPAPHVPLATLPGMRERTLRISSAGKTFSCTGWKIGWVSGPGAAGLGRAAGQAVPDLRQRRPAAAGGGRRARPARRLLRRVPRRPAGASGTCSPPGWPTAGFGVLPPEGTYFVTADITPARRRRRRRVLPRAARARAAWSPCRPRSSTTTRRRAGAGPVRVLQAPRGPRRGRTPAAPLTAAATAASPTTAGLSERPDGPAEADRRPGASERAVRAGELRPGWRRGPRRRCARPPPGRSSVPASTITRTSGSVPDGRSSTRPSPQLGLGRATAAGTARRGAPAARSRHRDVDQHLRQLRASPRPGRPATAPVAAIRAIRCSPVSTPSPVVA